VIVAARLPRSDWPRTVALRVTPVVVPAAVTGAEWQ
jgi:hypothetical protein